MSTTFGKAARQRLTLASVPRESDASDRLLDNSRQMVRLDLIDDNPRNPRVHMDADSLGELAASIAEHGLLQAPVVRRSPTDPQRYIVVLGARRVAAHRLLGREEIEVIVRRMDDTRAFLASCVENVQRVALTPREEMDLVGVLVDELRSQEAVARALGKSATWLSKRKRVLASPHLAAAVERGEISLDHAYDVLTRAPDEETARAYLDAVRNEGASQGQTRSRLMARQRTRRGSISADVSPAQIQERISDRNLVSEGTHAARDPSHAPPDDVARDEARVSLTSRNAMPNISDRNAVATMPDPAQGENVILASLAIVRLAAAEQHAQRDIVLQTLRADLRALEGKNT